MFWDIEIKQYGDPIPNKSKWRTTERSKLFHGNMCGLITLATNQQEVFLTFIDD